MKDIAVALDQLEKKITPLLSRETPRMGTGTAFPTGITSGYRFFRTDLGLECYYDGTRWLTEEIFECNLTPYARNPMPIAAGTGVVVLLSPQRTDYATYYVRGKAYMDIVAPNNATSYWGFTLFIGATTVWSADTHLDAAGAALNKEDATPQVCTSAAYAYATVSKVLTPGTLILNLTYWYRLIIT